MTTALQVTEMDSAADPRWEAVLARDRAADGRFVYAVRSTGIYCRPSCAARRPRRDRVQFFERPALAEAAGFRACRRCRPDEAAADDTRRLVERVRRLLDERPEEARLARLSHAVGRSPYYLQRTFKRIMGVTPREDAAAQRASRLKRELRTAGTVSRAQYAAGYGSSSRLYEQAGGRPEAAEPMPFWDVFPPGRWGVVTIMELAGFLGGLPNIELASLGRRTAEVEWDLLGLLGPAARAAAPSPQAEA